VFRRKSTDDTVAQTPETEPGTQGKGRPTPTRKEAEAARKAALTAQVDPKSARKAEREASRQARYEAQQGLRSGDPKKLPARDSGPVKAWVRDVVDGRISMGEIFIPVAVVVLVLGFVRVSAVQVALLWVWLFVLIGVVVDSLFLVWRLRRTLPVQFPDADPKVTLGVDSRGQMVYGLKGATTYAVIRSLQIRALRLPKPKVRWNGAPVTPKAPKTAKPTKP
jgi:hypothetical protein